MGRRGHAEGLEPKLSSNTHLNQINLTQLIKILSQVAADPTATPRNRRNLALVYGLSGDRVRAARIGREDLSEGEVENNLAYYERLRALPLAERTREIFGGGRPPRR